MCTVSTMMKNNAGKEIIFEIFVPHFKISGLKITPVVKVLQPNQQIDINIEYFSEMRKIGPMTLNELAN